MYHELLLLHEFAPNDASACSDTMWYNIFISLSNVSFIDSAAVALTRHFTGGGGSRRTMCALLLRAGVTLERTWSPPPPPPPPPQRTCLPTCFNFITLSTTTVWYARARSSARGPTTITGFDSTLIIVRFHSGYKIYTRIYVLTHILHTRDYNIHEFTCIILPLNATETTAAPEHNHY